MTEEYTIYLVIDLKQTSSLEDLKNIMRDSAINLNCIDEYFTHETEGINSTIKKNNIIYVVEFENLENLQQYIEFTKTLTKVKIELVCERDTIIYMSKQYQKTIDTNIVDKEDIEKKIEKYKSNNKYNRLYKLL
jgi:chemotaxis methyl-accepting protein methylase